MSLKIKNLVLASVLLCAAGTMAHAQEAETAASQQPVRPTPLAPPKPKGVIELRQDLNAARENQDSRAFVAAATALNKQRPNNAQYMVQAVLGYSMVGDQSGAYNMMLNMQQQGLSHDFDLHPETESIRDTEAYQYINDLLKIQGEPLGEVDYVHTLPASVQIPTSVAWDSTRESMLVGTARDGKVLAVDSEGNLQTLVDSAEMSGMWGVYGVLVDKERNRLWVTTAATGQFERFDRVDSGRSALFEFELDSLDFVRRLPVPVDGRPHRLAQMAQAPNGDLYIVDAVMPLIYRLEAGAERMTVFLVAPQMVSLRGIALSGDGRLLYLSDYEMGIAVADVEEETFFALKVPETLNIGGIEGLQWWNGYLLMIQNLNRPQRLMRLTLDPTGLAVSEVAPIAVANPGFDYPTHGAIVGDDILFLANSHWGSDPAAFKPIRIASSNVSDPADLGRPDMEKFIRDIEQAKGVSLGADEGE